MDRETLLALLGLLAGIVGILLTIKWPRGWRRLFVRWFRTAAPELPKLRPTGEKSRTELKLRFEKYILKPYNLAELGLQQGNPFSGVTTLEEPMVDCICTALSCNGRVYLILPSAESRPDKEGIGRTALTVRLLGLKPPYTKLIGASDGSPEDIDRLTLRFPIAGPWKLITSDMAYLGVSNGQLSVVPTNGEKLNFLWDLARHLFRSTDLTYITGDHREKKRVQLENLFYQMPCEGIDNVYADLNRAYPVDEILFVRRAEVSKPTRGWLRTISRNELYKYLEESILLSSEEHGSPFWNRPKGELKPVVSYMLDRITIRKLPRARELVLNSTGSNVPGFIYDEAVQLINSASLGMPYSDKSEEGDIFVGVDNYNSILYGALSSATTIKMLVTSGEKVFQDGAFWRNLVKLTRPFELEILMLDPRSPAVEELERSTYPDKPAGFLREEIETNIAVIKEVNAFLKKLEIDRLDVEKKTGAYSKAQPAASVRCWLYRSRPNLRMTFIDDRRSLIAHYLPGYRTGAETVFMDLYGPGVHHFVEILRQHYEQVKQASEEVL